MLKSIREGEHRFWQVSWAGLVANSKCQRHLLGVSCVSIKRVNCKSKDLSFWFRSARSSVSFVLHDAQDTYDPMEMVAADEAIEHDDMAVAASGGGSSGDAPPAPKRARGRGRG